MAVEQQAERGSATDEVGDDCNGPQTPRGRGGDAGRSRSAASPGTRPRAVRTKRSATAFAVGARLERERNALADETRAVQRELTDLRRSLEQESQHSLGPSDAARLAAVAAIEARANELAVPKTQTVRESNLFYDFDHWQPQSEHAGLSNKASNLGFLTADENRRKGKTEFVNLPELKQAVSLRHVLEAGEEATRKVVGDMLDSLRFSEVAELNVLWQRASRSETRSYSDSQAAFRQLLGSDNAQEPAAVRQAADTVRQALQTAGVDVVEHGKSFRLRLDDTTYRR